jgi:hypothetical protein
VAGKGFGQKKPSPEKEARKLVFYVGDGSKLDFLPEQN